MAPSSINIQSLEQQFSELLSIINYHRSLASRAVNEQQLHMAWNVGAYVSNKLKTEQWGSKVVTQFAEFAKVYAPDLKGFSRRNIYNMVMFYEEYTSPSFIATIQTFLPESFVQSATAQIQPAMSDIDSSTMATMKFPTTLMPCTSSIPEFLTLTSFTNHIAILNQCRTSEQRLF